jgi:phosphopantetheinyl transferase
MSATPKLVSYWPEMPVLPPPGQPVLIRLATSQSRQAARQELRSVLRRILAAWTNLSPEQLPLCETARGPVWLGQLGGYNLDINLSYSEDEGWIGFFRAGSIGVDVMQIQPIPEVEEVARHFLGHVALATIQQSTDPAMAFAMAWTEWEARLKCLKQELNEWSVTQTFTTTKCAIQTMIFPDRLMVTVASVTKNGGKNCPSYQPCRRG